MKNWDDHFELIRDRKRDDEEHRRVLEAELVAYENLKQCLDMMRGWKECSTTVNETYKSSVTGLTVDGHIRALREKLT